MTTRTVHLILLILLVALAAGVVLLSPPHEPESTPRAQPILTYLPAGAEVVITADLARLRATSLGRQLAAQGRELPAVGKLDQVCGFDPTEHMTRLAVSIPPTGLEGTGEPDFGVVVFGDFSADRLLGCASTVVAHRGGEPAVSRIGTFATVRDRSHPASGEVAVRDGGPAILGGGTYLRDLLDTAEGRGRSVQDEGVHGALREAVAPGGAGAVVVSWVVPPGRLAPSASDQGRSWAALRGVALRLDLTPEVGLKLLLGCAPRIGCGRVAAAVEQTRARLTPAARTLLGVGLDGVTVEEHPERLELSLRLSPQEAAALADALSRLGPFLGLPPPN